MSHPSSTSQQRIHLSVGRGDALKDLKVALQGLFKIGSELALEGYADKVCLDV